MTWTEATHTRVSCDDSIHKGGREFLFVHGVKVSAIDALKAGGWRYRADGQKHQCPVCVKARTRAS